MGELIFSFAYGGALIVMGFITRGFLKKMEAEPTVEKNKDGYRKVVQ